MLRTVSASLMLALLGTVCLSETLSAQEETVVHRQAHAHNDYLHDRPLLDALDNGFCSVEADVFLVDGQLLVAHSRAELSPERTLQGLYLEPLRTRVRKHAGSVHGDGLPITLLIDFKADGEATYQALEAILAEYSEMITSIEAGKTKTRAVNVIISGDRPIDAMVKDPLRFAGVDGRLSDLGSQQPPHLMPLISDNWRNHFRWKGQGEIPSAEYEKLKDFVDRCHAQGRLIRFWGTPDTKAAWEVLQRSKVDFINTDDLPGLNAFLRQR